MGKEIDSFLANWNVPSLPIKPTEIEVLYTFNALQNNDWVPPEIPITPFEIIQPVLGYGKRSATGGGSFWSIASWYVTLFDDVIQSTIIKVEPGNKIFERFYHIPGFSLFGGYPDIGLLFGNISGLSDYYLNLVL